MVIWQGLFVETMGEDRLHASIGVGPEMKSPGTRGLDPFCAITVGEADDA